MVKQIFMRETNRIEFKRELTRELDIEREVVAFLNYREGGTLYIGISDKQHIIGVDNSKKLMEDIPNKIVSKLGIYPDVRLLEEDGKEIIEIEVACQRKALTIPSRKSSRTWKS